MLHGRSFSRTVPHFRWIPNIIFHTFQLVPDCRLRHNNGIFASSRCFFGGSCNPPAWTNEIMMLWRSVPFLHFLHQNDFLYQSISTFHWSNGWKNVYGVRLCFRKRGRSRYYEVIFANSSFNNFTQTIAVISLISRSGLYSTMSAPTIS